MRIDTRSRRFMIASVLLVLAIAPVARAQDRSAGAFTSEELAQMVAPIALYSDPLLAQVLMAATYPTEVVTAERWTKKHPGLKGKELETKLASTDWDASVKSLCNFPSVLSMMSQNLEWTSKLGQAFVDQQDAVIDTIQKLRRKAQSSGNLQTTPQQTVVVEQQIIKIEPSQPEIVYVPQYDPVYVYGAWPYPAYPPPPVYYPGYSPAGAAAIGFTAGFIVGASVNHWCGWNWYHHNVWVRPPLAPLGRNVNINNINVNNINVNRWQHNELRAGSIHSTNVNAISANRTNVNAVSAHRTNVNAYSGSRTNVNAFSGSRTSVNAVSGHHTNVSSFSGSRTDVHGLSERSSSGSFGHRTSYDSTLQKLQTGSSGRANAFGGMEYGRSERLASSRGESSRTASASRSRSSQYSGSRASSYSGSSHRSGGFSGGRSGGGRRR